jgi:hypothetical protein
VQSNNAVVLPAAPIDFAALMRSRGKSFYLASLMLPRAVAQRAMALYGFCRQVDDIADGDAPLGAKQAQLNALLAQLKHTTVPTAVIPVFSTDIETAPIWSQRHYAMPSIGPSKHKQIYLIFATV